MGFKRKFEIGDKVIVKSTKEVGEVIDYYNREYHVSFDDYGGYGWYRAEKLEKYEEKPDMPETDNSDPKEWKVGDRVVVVRRFKKADVGLTGTVIILDNFPAIEFDEYMSGHSCGKLGKPGHCWWITNGYRGYVKRLHKKEEPTKMPVLETGMKVEFRNGEFGLVVTNVNTRLYGKQDFVILMNGSFVVGNRYNDCGKHIENSDYNIERVYASTNGNGDVLFSGSTLTVSDVSSCKKLWERDYTKKVTKKQAEKELSEKHGVKVVIEG